MAHGLAAALAQHAHPPLTGWVNVVDGQTQEAGPIRVFQARPAGINLPTERVLEGTRQIMNLIDQTGPGDLVIGLLSGGGSALLELPAADVSLEQICQTTQAMSSSGTDIETLNVIRSRLSQVKAGGLARRILRRKSSACCLVLSDIIGDPLPAIASGPLWLEDLQPDQVPHTIVGNNRTAVDAAAMACESLGYQTEIIEPDLLPSTANANQHARVLVQKLGDQANVRQPRAYVWGGEPVVDVGDATGRGGRNQHLILCAAIQCSENGQQPGSNNWCLLSGATDSEDGNTTRAGAWVDAISLREIQNRWQFEELVACRDQFDSGRFCQEFRDWVATGSRAI